MKMAVTVVMNYGLQNFQCADIPVGLRMSLVLDDTCCGFIQMLVHLNVHLCCFIIMLAIVLGISFDK